MIKNLFFLCVFFSLSIVNAQKKPKEFRVKKIEVLSDTVYIDSVSIHPKLFKVFNSKGKLIPKKNYHIDFAKAQLIFKENKDDNITVEYLKYPEFLTKIHTPIDESRIVPNTISSGKLYSLTTNKKKGEFKLFDGLKTQGFISRGITTGNNQNAVTNASLDLTLEGKLSEKVSIRANIFDTNFPLQQNGYSQNITDFDRIFIELFSKNWKVKGGDLSLGNKDSYFLSFEKQVSGIEVKANLTGNTNIAASGAIVRGKFSSFNFVGIEGNQGPYKILGPNNESAIIIVAGSDAVYVNGILLERGENKDYNIDYNLAEIRFNTTYPITNDMRVRVEFQFSERNYTRFITYEKAQYASENFSITGYFYNENDAKSQPIQQSLSVAQKQILAAAGNDISKMVAPSAFKDEFSSTRIQYKKVLIAGEEVFEYSTDENDELFNVTFNNVGANKGSYEIDRTIAIGTIYKYVGINLGNFDPLIRLVAPNSLQVAVLKTRYAPSKRTILNAELGFSDNDANLFSNIGDEKNKQLATKFDWQQVILDKPWKLESTIDYEFIQEKFTSVQRFRTVEFNRNWNVINQLGDQHQIATSLLLTKKKSTISYRFNHLNFTDSFNGNKHELSTNLVLDKTLFSTEGSLLNSNSLQERGTFFKLRSKAQHQFKNSWLGGFVSFETNTIKEKLTNTSVNRSHRFKEYETFYGIGDSTKVFAKLGFNYRTNDSIRSENFRQINDRRTVYLNSQLIQNKRTNLSIFANYRFTKNTFKANEKSLNSKLVYNQQFFNKFINIGSVYETSSGNIAQQDFVYVETEPGQGFYTWIDYNNDGIQQFEEFEIAQFQDQASYLRVPLPNLTFLPTQRASLKQNVIINPAQWKQNTGVKKAFSHFYNHTYFLIDNEQKRIGDTFNLNPFDLDEEKQLGLQFTIRNSFYFNRNLQNYSLIYTYGKSRNKQQLTIGSQENSSFIHQLQVQHKLSKYWLFDVTTSISKNNLTTQNFATRNYIIDKKELNPKLTFLYDKDHRLSMFYHFKEKKNSINNLEELNQHKIGLDYFFLSKKKNQVVANFNMFLNDFSGNSNSPVGYQMLEGLQVGKNYTWSLLFNQKLNSILNLSVNYLGRKSPTASTIHTGTVQLKAIF